MARPKQGETPVDEGLVNLVWAALVLRHPTHIKSTALTELVGGHKMLDKIFDKLDHRICVDGRHQNKMVGLSIMEAERWGAPYTEAQE